MNRWIAAASAVAKAGPGVGKNRYRHGAVIVDGSKVLATGFNQLKTHRKLASFTKHPYLHAETAAILRAGLDACEGSDLYVVRIDRRGHLAESCPCETCQAVINEAGLRHVYYTNDSGNVSCLF